MGNNAAKKLAAQQHNDAIDYRKWLINSTLGQTRQLPVARLPHSMSGRSAAYGMFLFSQLCDVETIRRGRK